MPRRPVVSGLSETLCSEMSVTVYCLARHNIPEDHVVKIYDLTDRVTILYILILNLRIAGREMKHFEVNCSKHFPSFICS
jgi:hypothetical protein